MPVEPNAQKSWSIDELQEIHEMDKRIIVLENEIPHILRAIDNTNTHLQGIDEKMGIVNQHMITQNIVLPSLKDVVTKLLDRVEKSEEKTVEISVKSKIVWAIFTAIFTGVLLSLLKYSIGV